MKQLTFIGMFALATALCSAPALADNNNGRHSGWNSEKGRPLVIGHRGASGYLPEAIINFIALVGWSPGGDREKMTLDEMTSLFSLDRINKTGTTVVMATHDQRIVNMMRKRVIQLDRGIIVRDQARGVYE